MAQVYSQKRLKSTDSGRIFPFGFENLPIGLTVKNDFFLDKKDFSMEQFNITGMTCSACSSRIEKSVAKLPGIQEVSVNLLKNSMAAAFCSFYNSAPFLFCLDWYFSNQERTKQGRFYILLSG